MSLTLVTGPANAAKAGYVLERLREVLHREPLLVVPTAADVAHYQRELAAGEVVFGAEVLTFSRLWRGIGSVGGGAGRALRGGARGGGGGWAGWRACRGAGSECPPASASCGPRSATPACGCWRRRPGRPGSRAPR